MQSNCIKVLYKDVNYQLKTQNNFQNCCLKFFFFRKMFPLLNNRYERTVLHSLTASFPYQSKMKYFTTLTIRFMHVVKLKTCNLISKTYNQGCRNYFKKHYKRDISFLKYELHD